jgi:hypothetical protein
MDGFEDIGAVTLARRIDVMPSLSEGEWLGWRSQSQLFPPARESLFLEGGRSRHASEGMNMNILSLMISTLEAE